jgi:hypothetical protein
VKPTAHKPTWIVYTTGDLSTNFAMDTPSWVWTAQGPRGSESGMERSPGDATQKARAAAYLLDEPRREKTSTGQSVRY